MKTKEAYLKFLHSSQGAEFYNEKFKKVLYNPSNLEYYNAKEDSLVAAVSKFLEAHIKYRNNISILDVGTGDGSRFSAIIKELVDKKFDIKKLIAIEPSSYFFSKLENTLKSLGILYEIYNQKFEDFNQEIKVDCIILLHSIFTFRNNDWIKSLFSLIRPGGIIVVVTNNPNSLLGSLKAIIDQQIGEKRYELENFLDFLKKNNHRYYIESKITSWSVSRMQNNQFISDLLFWMTLGMINEFPENIKIQLYNVIKKFSKEVGDEIIYTEEEKIILIQNVGI